MARRNAKRKLSKKEQKALTKEGLKVVDLAAQPVERRRDAVSVALPLTITIAQLAVLTGRRPAEIVGALLGNGVIATVNDSVDRETVEIIAEELDLEITAADMSVVSQKAISDSATATRPPVVVVLGHVDHGKTTLLDSIRKANVVAGESGGITQHIGAYQVEVPADGSWSSPPTSSGSSKNKTLRQAQGNFAGPTRKITFIDTPGHEAFSAMRAHGVTMTDVAILVVAADDGVKPQTKEAVSHARAANIPIIVAINKVDAPGAQVDRVKGELAELDLAAEDWAGKTPTVLVSAKKQTGIDDLLDTVLLVADLAELQARTSGPGEGVVIEAHMEQGVGPVATVLVQHGTLEVGQSIVVGDVYGRIRRMEDDTGAMVKIAGPATPVRVAGLNQVPSFGALVSVVDSDKLAKEVAKASTTGRPATVWLDASDSDEAKGKQTLAVVLKADVDGSLKAIQTSLEAIPVEGVNIRVIHQGVGDLSESDVNLAIASEHPYLVAFRTGATIAARNLARSKQLTIQAYDIIYRLIEDVTEAATKLKAPELVTIEHGRLKVLEVFHTTKTTQIIGGRVEQGSVVKGGTIEILREGESVGTGSIETLQRGQQKSETVAAGEECGLGVSTTESIEAGDVLVVTTQESK